MATTGNLTAAPLAARPVLGAVTLLRIAILIAIVAIWEAVAASGLLFRDVVPSLLVIGRQLVLLLTHPDFPLHELGARFSQILVAGANFGCGSSREHAPWALKDFGITCVISTSFGDIFYNNCFKNGVLPIKVSPEDLEKLFDDAERGANATLSIDLEKQEIRGPDGGVVKFDIDPHRKHCLLNGLDDIGLTMVKADKIKDFEAKAEAARPWA